MKSPSEKAADRVLDLPALIQRLDQLRRRGKKVVFTNGCFDLVHAGHACILEGAAAHGDLLVVGLNSDESVARLKGPGRPVIPQRARALLLASLRGVDFVVIFKEETPQRLIEAILPDVLVKGEDYPLDRIVGREVVEAHGGRVVRLPLLEDLSTSVLLEKLRRL